MDEASYVYMMSSSSRRALYTGITARFRSRVFEHKNDLVEGFSSKYKCHRLVYFERFERVVDAIAREKRDQGMAEREKEQAGRINESNVEGLGRGLVSGNTAVSGKARQNPKLKHKVPRRYSGALPMNAPS